MERARRLLKGRRLLVVALAVGLLAMCTLLYATWSSRLVVTRYEVEFSPSGRVVRIVQLSDLHIRGFGGFEREVVSRVVELSPDLVVLTGDYANDEDHLRYLEEFIKALRSRLEHTPMYAVVGNWELQASTERRVAEIFDRYGVTLLNNSYDVLVVNGVKLVVVGLDDGLWGSPDVEMLRALPEADLHVLLVHEPSLALKAAEVGFKGLAFAGHCHGGQVRILGVPVFLPEGCPRGLYEGLHEVNDTVIIVSRGLGTTLIPVRLGVNPEVVVVDARV